MAESVYKHDQAELDVHISTNQTSHHNEDDTNVDQKEEFEDLPIMRDLHIKARDDDVVCKAIEMVERRRSHEIVVVESGSNIIFAPPVSLVMSEYFGRARGDCARNQITSCNFQLEKKLFEKMMVLKLLHKVYNCNQNGSCYITEFNDATNIGETHATRKTRMICGDHSDSDSDDCGLAMKDGEDDDDDDDEGGNEAIALDATGPHGSDLQESSESSNGTKEDDWDEVEQPLIVASDNVTTSHGDLNKDLGESVATTDQPSVDDIVLQERVIDLDSIGTTISLGDADQHDNDHKLNIGSIVGSTSTVAQVDQIRSIGHYNNRHKILLVGEGNFSFSSCLATAFRAAPNLTATSLDSRGTVIENYSKGKENLENLVDRGAVVIHQVDVHSMNNHPQLRRRLFDRIVYNFPHGGAAYFSIRETTKWYIELHQMVVRGFFATARYMLVDDGEVHVTHKTAHPFNTWNIVELAEEAGLALSREVKFYRWEYPGYENKKAYGSSWDTTFPVGEASTFMFRKSR